MEGDLNPLERSPDNGKEILNPEKKPNHVKIYPT